MPVASSLSSLEALVTHLYGRRTGQGEQDCSRHVRSPEQLAVRVREGLDELLRNHFGLHSAGADALRAGALCVTSVMRDLSVQQKP